MKSSNTQDVFLGLLQAGLWATEYQYLKTDAIDWNVIYSIAEAQSVPGLILAGLEHSNVKPPQELLLQWIGEVHVIEQQNKAMNSFVGLIFEQIKENGIDSLLVKGQGIALCYEKPLWRCNGDVDLLLTELNYEKAYQLLVPNATSVENEIKAKKHVALTIDSWVVELHGSLKDGLWKSLDKGIEKAQNSAFLERKRRSWINGKTQINIPAPDEDVIFVFSHILQHFYKEGIGLRQICDWCRLLYTYKDSLNLGLLELRIKSMGMMTEWKAFAALTVDYLGMPVEAMPLYSDDKKWSRKAGKVMDFILETGNFGHNRDYSYQKKHSYVVMKSISLWKHLQDFGRYFVIFPLDATRVTWNRMCVGFSVALRGKRHE